MRLRTNLGSALALAGFLTACSGPSSSATSADDGAAGSSGSNLHASGVLTPAGYVPAACVNVEGQAAPAGTCNASAPAAATQDPYGWVEWGNKTLPHGASSLSVHFNVPPEPRQRSSQTIFIFPSFIAAIHPPIIQPVLQWGESASGGGKYWTVGNWYIDGNLKTQSSKLVKVSAGDELVGTISGSGSSWTVVAQDLTHPVTTTLNAKVTGVQFTSAQAAVLEVYNMSSCAEYPAGNVEFTQVQLVNGDGGVQSGAWHPKYISGVTPSCAAKVLTPTDDSVTLTWDAGT